MKQIYADPRPATEISHVKILPTFDPNDDESPRLVLLVRDRTHLQQQIRLALMCDMGRVADDYGQRLRDVESQIDRITVNTPT